MLYVKFTIQDASKFEDFENVYNHMLAVRQPGFQFKEEDPVFDWDRMSEEEISIALEKLNIFLDEEPEARRYKALIPDYANVFLENYVQYDAEKSDFLGIHDVLSIFNYLEYGFEVEVDHFGKLDEHSGIFECETDNYPFGGMERLLITLKAFDLVPTEWFDGFSICEFKWTSDFEYTITVFPEKTKEYINKE